MTILFFAHSFIYGGGEKVRNWLANQLINDGHTVIYATPEISPEIYDDIEKVGLLNRVKLIEYPFNIKKKHPIKYAKAIKSIYHTHKVDLLIYFGGSLVEQVIAKLNGVKVLLSERCDPHSRSIPAQILKQVQYRIADGYVFQTPDASKCYGKRTHRLSTVIPNPIIDKLGEPQYDNLRKEVVSVGRLSKEKNQKDLITAFSIFAKDHPDYILKIYGSGALKDQLIKQIHNLRLDERIEIISGKTNISELIKGAELFVLNSNTEGMPNALIEAMSMGILSISTDCPIYGPRFLVRDGENAFLTPLRDAERLAVKMSEALSHPNANEIRRNAVKIRETLNPLSIHSKWKQYIENL